MKSELNIKKVDDHDLMHHWAVITWKLHCPTDYSLIQNSDGLNEDAFFHLTLWGVFLLHSTHQTFV